MRQNAQDQNPAQRQDRTSGMPRLGAGYEFDGLMLDYIPAHHYEVHFQDDWDVISIVCSRADIEIAFDTDKIRPVVLQPYGLSYHPAGTKNYTVSIDPSYDFVAARINPEIKRELQDEFRVKDENIRSLCDVSNLRTKCLADLIGGFVRAGAPGGRLAAQSHAVLAMAETIGVLSDRPANETGSRLRPNLNIQRAVDYIETCFSEDVSLDALAGVAAMSLYHFSRCFKETTGTTPHAYVTARRIKHAQHLLQFSQVPLASIAFDCGFSSQSHFTTAFRNAIGTTPARFRKQTQD